MLQDSLDELPQAQAAHPLKFARMGPLPGRALPQDLDVPEAQALKIAERRGKIQRLVISLLSEAASINVLEPG